LGPIICFSAVSQVNISLVTNKVFKTTRDSSFAQNGENYIVKSSVIGTLLIFPSSQTKEEEAKDEEEEEEEKKTRTYKYTNVLSQPLAKVLG